MSQTVILNGQITGIDNDTGLETLFQSLNYVKNNADQVVNSSGLIIVYPNQLQPIVPQFTTFFYIKNLSGTAGNVVNVDIVSGFGVHRVMQLDAGDIFISVANNPSKTLAVSFFTISSAIVNPNVNIPFEYLAAGVYNGNNA